MRKLYKKGDKKIYKKRIEKEDVASFHHEMVHPVCATFSLARDIEWTSRQFVIDMKEEDEEGIGTMLTIDHQAPALLGEEIAVEASVYSFEENELICTYNVKVGERVIAKGKTGQKILKKEKISRLLKNLAKS